MSGEIQRRVDASVAVRNMLLPYEGALADLIPRTGVAPRAFLVYAEQAVMNSTDENLRARVAQNPESFMSALMKCAILGHLPGTKEASLVSFGGMDPKIELIEQYHGLISRAQRAAPGLVISSGVIHENDRYIKEEVLGEPFRHQYDVFGNEDKRGRRVGVYAQARLPQGTYTQSVTLNNEQIAKIRAMSRTPKFWNQWPDEMAQKAAIKRIRGLPTSAEWRQETETLVVRANEVARENGFTPPNLHDDPEILDIDPSQDDNQ